MSASVIARCMSLSIPDTVGVSASPAFAKPPLLEPLPAMAGPPVDDPEDGRAPSVDEPLAPAGAEVADSRQALRVQPGLPASAKRTTTRPRRKTMRSSTSNPCARPEPQRKPAIAVRCATRDAGHGSPDMARIGTRGQGSTALVTAARAALRGRRRLGQHCAGDGVGGDLRQKDAVAMVARREKKP